MRKQLLLLLIGALLMLSGSVFAQDDDPIVFGFVVDETGIGAIFAKSQLAGLDIAMDILNENGGILGREVTYIKQDSELDATKGATIAEQFVLEDGVDFLLGPTSSGVALAVTEIARENKIPIAFHTSNTVALSTTNWHPYMVQVVPHTSIESRAIAQYMADSSDLSMWATIGPDYSFGRDSFATFSERLLSAADGAEIITEQWPPLSDRDMTPYLTAIQANAPEALYGVLWGEQAVTFVQAAADFGLFDELEYAGLMDTDFMKGIGDELPEGLVGYARAPFYAIDTPEMEEFVTRYVEANDEYPSDWGIMIYDAVMALAAAAEEAGSTDGDAIAEALGNDLTFTGLRGELTVRSCDHMANVGEYVGVSTQDSEYGFPILTDVQFIPAEDVWDSCEDIEAMREESDS